MKAERRHQLQTNSLDHVLQIAPHFFRRYGSQILLGVAIVVLLVVLVRRRAENAHEAAERQAEALTTARSYVDQVQTAMLTVNPGKPENLVEVVKNVREMADKHLEIAAESEDPKILAEVRIARGDLNWQLAGLPEIPGAATRPSLKLDKTDAEYLESASKAYQEVLNDGASPTTARVTARLSLATIAEDQKKWDDARKQYQAVIDDSATGEPFKAQARERLKALDDLKVEPFVGKTPPPAPPTIPSPMEGPMFPSSGFDLTPKVIPGAPATPSSEPPVAPTTPAPTTPAPAPSDAPKTDPTKPATDAGAAPVEKK
jgi:hypothetical protein